ncbi:MAG: nucleoid occlusion factor SlmA [Gammaproteobacteria bacterium]|nr:nucleoid occlusion factor SlmA [Gammaproteobacteria bacterium]
MTNPSEENLKTRRKFKPGERKEDILRCLVDMLGTPKFTRVTTASLAENLAFSEAALYRHFENKEQIFILLIQKIEEAIFPQIMQIKESDNLDIEKVVLLVRFILKFADQSPGLCRVLIGDALVLESPKVIKQMSFLFDKIESILQEMLRAHYNHQHNPTPSLAAQSMANFLIGYLIGDIQRFVRSGFVRKPAHHLDQIVDLLLNS